MPDISLVIDGQPRNSTGGEPRAPRGSRRTRAVIAIKVNGVARDLATLEEARPSKRSPSSEDGLNILRHSARARLPGRPGCLPRREPGHRPFITDGFTTTSETSTPSSPSLLRELEKRMKRIIRRASASCAARSEEDDAVGACRPAYKLELVTRRRGAPKEPPSRSAPEASPCTTTSDDGTVAWKGPVPRPPPALHKSFIETASPSAKSSAAYWKGDQNGGPAAAHLRHRGHRRKTWSPTRKPSRKQNAATTAARRRTEPVPASRGDRPRPVVFHPKGGILRHEIESYVTTIDTSGRDSTSSTRRDLQGRALPHSGHLPSLRETPCSRPCSSTRTRRDGNVTKAGQE